MDAMELLRTRASNGKLGEPAPDEATMNEILSAALRAPDHGAVRPWKIFAVRGDARSRLGDLFAEIEGDAEKERARRKPLRAPLLLVVAAVVEDSEIAPPVEQLLSAGALAHGILLGLQAKGFAGMWRTGDAAYHPRIKRAFGLREQDHLVAFLYVGTPTQPYPDTKRPSVDEHLVEWAHAVE
jgi:nitroreductase